MTNDQRLICWDTNIFIAWFQDDSTHPLGAIEAEAERLWDGESHLIVPTMVVAEFHAIAGKREVVRMFDSWIQSEFCTFADLTPAIAELAGDICSSAPSKIKPMDAVFVASAQLRNVDTAWTLDKKLLKAIRKHESLTSKSRFKYPGEGTLSPEQ